ncbi:MAG TPA: nitroreductase/quinone reductase family protein [Candidatus Deferrimicrobium sp.]|nr:nitroreductase/quinone reductase family protein [Candidatus Deferrimicrobium sp.]
MTPPRWFVRGAWVGHRALYSATRGRIGLRLATPERWGMLRLLTTGCQSGQERRAILGYFEDGRDLILMFMNGWSEGATGWSLNLRAHPKATVELADGTRRPAMARFAEGEEREQLWARWGTYDQDLEGFAARRSDTPVIVLEPRAAG